MSSQLFDCAKKHFENENFPSKLPIEQAQVYIGFYMGWFIDQNLFSEYFEEECELQIYRFKKRELSPVIISAIWEGKLKGDYFVEYGNLFTIDYYASGDYKEDYKKTFEISDSESFYSVKDNWDNFFKINKIITDRYIKWKQIHEISL